MSKQVIILHSNPIWLQQTQTWIYSQLAELQRLGVATPVVCERTENLDQFGVVDIHCLEDEKRLKRIWDKGLRKLRIRRHLNYVAEIGKKTGADILHSHFGNIGWANLGAVRRLGVKHVVTFYGLDVNKLPTQFPVWRKRYRRLFEEVDLILCEGSHMARCIVALGCPEHKVKVQHLGVDVERILFKPRQWQPGQPLRVLIAASFREKKGIPYAIEALGELRKEIPVELTLIGDAGTDQESRQEKAKILKTLECTGLKSNTRLLGYQPYSIMLQEAYAHHVFLQPSVTASNGDTEGGAPVSIIEMLASGMSVVSTRHCDIPEVMGPELHHLLAPERDAAALVDIIGKLLSKPETWTGLAHAGRTHIEVEYNKTTQGRCLFDSYGTLLGSRTA